MMGPWQALGIYIVIAVVILFILNLYLNPKDEDDEFLYLFSIVWPLSLGILAAVACFFVLFVLPASAAKWCHKKTTPPEAP